MKKLEQPLATTHHTKVASVISCSGCRLVNTNRVQNRISGQTNRVEIRALKVKDWPFSRWSKRPRWHPLLLLVADPLLFVDIRIVPASFSDKLAIGALRLQNAREIDAKSL